MWSIVWETFILLSLMYTMVPESVRFSEEDNFDCTSNSCEHFNSLTTLSDAIVI